MIPENRRAAEHDCARVATRFFTNLDATDYEGTWAQMAPGGIWKRSGKSLDGREIFLAAMAQRPKALVIRHLLSNFIVDFSGDNNAKSDFCLTVFRFIGDPGGKPAPISLPSAVAAFHATFVRVEDEWKILELSGETLFA
jgi:SnoaL-like domain